MQLTQPWDKAALTAELKSKGINIADEALKGLVDSSFAWVEQSCALLAATQPAYAVGAMVLPKINELIDTGIDNEAKAIGG